MIKNGGNLCYRLDFAAATSCRDTQAAQAQKREVELEWEAPTS